MAINTKHPAYARYQPDWQLCRDAYRGERVVKDKTVTYLPATSGMVADGMQTVQSPGYQAYMAYLIRAVFPDFMSMAVEHFIGMMHAHPPAIELPAALEPLRTRAGINGDPMEHLLRRINEQQLVTGRVGLLLDLPRIPDPANPLPYIALYNAEAVINWDDGAADQVDRPVLNLVVLDESEPKRVNQFDWKDVEQYRVLALGDLALNERTGIYRQGLFSADTTLSYNDAAMIEPGIRGRTLDRIPFEFINSKDTVSAPDDPPLLGLARLCMAIYRGEADYRQNLFMQGQDTLVVIGGTNDDDDNLRTGTGARIDLPQGGDAKYIGVNSQGLSEQRQSLENDRALAGQQAGQLATAKSNQIESGDSLKTRIAAQTATLNQIALAGAMGLERLLKTAATWVGADPEQVKVTPNLEFAESAFTTKELVEMMTAKNMGAPLSRKSIHETMVDRGFTKLDYETEISEIEEEEPLGGSSQERDALEREMAERGIGQQEDEEGAQGGAQGGAGA